MWIGRPSVVGVAFAMVAAVVSTMPLSAERLAARRYTTADGLAGDYIIHATRDSRGFLWFATRDGLSRFDGVRFVTYGMADGLPAATVNHLLETRAGVYWVATNGGGVCRFNPQGHRRLPNERRQPDSSASEDPDALFLECHVGKDPAANRVNITYEDRKGQIWLGTDRGLFLLNTEAGSSGFREVPLPNLSAEITQHGVAGIVEDADASLWIAGSFGIRRLLPDGRMVTYRMLPERARESSTFVRIDPAARVWVGFTSGVLRLDPISVAAYSRIQGPLVRTVDRSSAEAQTLSEPSAAAAGAEKATWYTQASGLPDNQVTTAYFRRDGHIWFGTPRGVAEFDGTTLRAHGPARGVPSSNITDILEDSSGHLWITSVSGATKIVRDGLVTYDQADGLPNVRIHSISEDSRGTLFVLAGGYEVSEFDGTKFASVRPPAVGPGSCPWMSRCALLDQAGDWWVATTSGLLRWSGVSRVTEFVTRPPSLYDHRKGLPAEQPYGVFEDRAGNMWVGFISGELRQWQHATGHWRTWAEADGLPPQEWRRVTALVDHPTAGFWIAFDQGHLARRRGDRFEVFDESNGLPAGTLAALLVDSANRLWVATTQGGVARVDQPSADRPVLATVTTADGLGSNNVRCLVEGDRGYIYLGTSRGVDRLDPRSGSVKHFSSGEGLASDFVTAAFRDRHGRIWFGTISGLSRLDVDDASTLPGTPAVFIGDLTAGGTSARLSELGETAPASLVLAPDRNQLEIGFFGFSFDSGAPLRYQYRLDGSDGDWSPPAETRSVNYASLAAGSYRFLVRAVRNDGAVSAMPAVVAFRVLPPFYARWWFVTLLAAALAALALVLYRMRVAQLLRVERVRARIATDLHDDIGASLSQIAILAEVARGRLSQEDRGAEAAQPLDRIAETSRGLVDSMSDIVWAINPEVDTLSDLVRRIRRFVEDTLGASDVELRLTLPDGSQEVRLGADVRREVLLILKESVTNIGKHARATRVGIELMCDRHRLRLRVSDDGRGFDPAESTDGNGVASMRRRVASLGGHLEIDSAPGRGTTISFEIHL